MNQEIKINLLGGKYKYHFTNASAQLIYRNGIPWRDETGDGFILAMAQEIEELRERLAHALLT